MKHDFTIQMIESLKRQVYTLVESIEMVEGYIKKQNHPEKEIVLPDYPEELKQHIASE